MICVFFFNDTATTEIYTLSLHDALPISDRLRGSNIRRGHRPRIGTGSACDTGNPLPRPAARAADPTDRKSTRLNSSHSQISYAVFCLKKKTISLCNGCGYGAAHCSTPRT